MLTVAHFPKRLGLIPLKAAQDENLVIKKLHARRRALAWGLIKSVLAVQKGPR
jgi:hypothetical protein